MAALADILAKMRKVADSHASIGPSALRVYADRIEEEVKREREEWSSRVADAHEVAEDFKNTLTKALDTLAWLKSAESPAARGCGENGGGSSRKNEIEAS